MVGCCNRMVNHFHQKFVLLKKDGKKLKDKLKNYAGQKKDIMSTIRNQVICPLCKSGFRNLNAFGNHLIEVHDEQKNDFTCQVCNQVYINQLTHQQKCKCYGKNLYNQRLDKVDEVDEFFTILAIVQEQLANEDFTI